MWGRHENLFGAVKYIREVGRKKLTLGKMPFARKQSYWQALHFPTLAV
jgi:hypothetical protein